MTHSGSPRVSTQARNTASVFKFTCLYTHDLVRKQKRWQDGFLCFHSFNRRIMIYDTASNFVGDTHWQEAAEIQDGDELRVDQGLIIQVGEALGRKEQDLSDLLEKRRARNGHSQRQISRGHTHIGQSLVSNDMVQRRAKPIHAILSQNRRPTTSPTSSPGSRRLGVPFDAAKPPVKKLKTSDAATSIGTRRTQRDTIESLSHFANERPSEHQRTSAIASTTVRHNKQHPLERQRRLNYKPQNIANSRGHLRSSTEACVDGFKSQRGVSDTIRGSEVIDLSKADRSGEQQSNLSPNRLESHERSLQVLLPKKAKRKKLVCEERAIPNSKFQTRSDFSQPLSRGISVPESATNAKDLISSLFMTTESTPDLFESEKACHLDPRNSDRYSPKKVKDKPGPSVLAASSLHSMKATDSRQRSTPDVEEIEIDLLSDSANFQRIDSGRTYQETNITDNVDEVSRAKSVRQNAQRSSLKSSPQLRKVPLEDSDILSPRTLVSKRMTESSAEGPWTREAFDLFGWSEGISKARKMST